MDLSELRSKTLVTDQAQQNAVSASPLSWQQLVAKRSLDIALSSVLIALFLPFLTLIAFGIWIDSGRPIFFRQLRGGLAGRPFAILKFRTMAVMEDGPEVSQVRRNDPRVTRFGAFLRRTSLDEMPQLWNVLVGEMSLVGPRPHALAHDEQFHRAVSHYMLRQRVKPGLTGLAQIQGWRGETSNLPALAGRVNADLSYIENWSFWLDLKIIARTACIVLIDRRAY